ncbi:MAG: hypothetical protein WBA41_26495 [Rivularia sp. (in: cyanobacteria)]
MKTQVNLGAIQQTLLNRFLAGAKHFKRVKYSTTLPYMFVVKGMGLYQTKQQFELLFDKLIENFYDSGLAFGSVSPLMMNQKRQIIPTLKLYFCGVFH